MKKPKPNKQPKVAAASFKRLATQIRKIGKEGNTFYEFEVFANNLAKAFDAEVKLLRAKR